METMTAPGPFAAAARTSDFATVRWNGETFCLTRMQRRVVQELWQVAEAGVPFVDQHTLLEVAESDQRKLSALFRNSPAWGALVAPGPVPGTYGLAPARPGKGA